MDADAHEETASPDLLDYDQTAQLLGVPKGTVYSWVHLRTIPHIRLGPRLVRFARTQLLEWLRERSVRAT